MTDMMPVQNFVSVFFYAASSCRYYHTLPSGESASLGQLQYRDSWTCTWAIQTPPGTNAYVQVVKLWPWVKHAFIFWYTFKYFFSILTGTYIDVPDLENYSLWYTKRLNKYFFEIHFYCCIYLYLLIFC